jgi:hypothetical protein
LHLLVYFLYWQITKICTISKFRKSYLTSFCSANITIVKRRRDGWTATAQFRFNEKLDAKTVTPTWNQPAQNGGWWRFFYFCCFNGFIIRFIWSVSVFQTSILIIFNQTNHLIKSKWPSELSWTRKEFFHLVISLTF